MKNTISLLALTAIMMLGSACAKKDSDFKGRYATNASGARAIDAGRSEQAANYAQTFGLKNLDVINIRKQGYQGGFGVESTILLNDTALDIKTAHQADEEIQTSTPININGYSVYVNTRCSNANCDFYFIMLTAYQNGSPVMQAGVMKSFNPTYADTYQWISGSGFVPFYSSDWYDKGTMIGILLSK